jgi:hypothetical protein
MRKDLTSLVQRPQAASTEMHPAHLPLHPYPHALDVRFELTVGCPLGVADVVPELRAFATHFTFRHSYHLGIVCSEAYHTTG